MARIAVVGAGMMGSALCVPLSDAGQAVHLVGTSLDDAIIAQLQATGQHSKLQLSLPEGTHFHQSSELGSVLADVARPEALPLSRRELPLLSHLIELGLEGAPLAMPFEEFFRT